MENKMDLKEQERMMNLAFATSDFYQLLSVSLQFPSEELAKAMSEGSYREDGISILEELSCSKVDILPVVEGFNRLSETNGTAEQLFTQMRQEYTRLVNDPKQPLIPIYESLFLYEPKENGEKPMLFLNQIAADVERCYKEAGANVTNQSEPADHMAIELEFMMFLYGNKGKMLKEQNQEGLAKINKLIQHFENRHVGKWGFPFFERLEVQAAIEPYKVLAQLANVGLRQVLHVKDC